VLLFIVICSFKQDVQVLSEKHSLQSGGQSRAKYKKYKNAGLLKHWLDVSSKYEPEGHSAAAAK